MGTTSIRPLARFKAKLIAKSEKGAAGKLLGWARRYGAIGVFLVAALPFFGGGVWTGVLLAYVLGLKKTVSYSALLLGCLVGIALLALGVHIAGSFAVGYHFTADREQSKPECYRPDSGFSMLD